MKLTQIEFAFVFLGGFYLAMAALHVILYVYNRHRKSNLVYAIGLGFVSANYTLVDLSSEVSYSLVSQKADALMNAATNGILVYFVAYYILASTIPLLKNIVRALAVFYLVGFAGLIILSPTADLFSIIDNILRLTCYITAASICIFGLLKKIPNFYLIVTATVLLILTEVFLAVDLFDFWPAVNAYPLERVVLIIIGYTTPYLAYSTYLSKDLALTSKKLTKEHIMNERLTREKYEQELVTRKILEAQNIELERSVFERTREISRQKEELETQSEKILEIDKIKSRFFANISHEFRTPLTLIQSPIKKRLAEATSPKDLREYTVINQNATRLLQLVNQLLDLSRLESGALALKASNAELISFVTPIVEAFQSLAEVKMIQLSLDFQASAISIYLDPEKLDKIINNLLSNAFKFTPSGGEVTVSVRSFNKSERFPDGYAEIQVTDTGIGIGKEHLPKVLNRFYQVDSSQTREYEGTGIGLAITKEFVELHQGELTISSELGAGTSVMVRLPLGKSHLHEGEFTEEEIRRVEQQTATESVSKGILSDNGHSLIYQPAETILIVEDHDDLRHYIRENLAEQYHIIEASNGEQGIELALSQIPDLIISDVMMPKVDGLQLCKKLKNDEKTSHIPIIMLTAKADIESKLEGLGTGADDYIPKPFDINELQLRVLNLIQNRKKLQEKYARQVLLKPGALEVKSADERFLQKILTIVEEHVGDTSLGVDSFAREACMSTAQLYRKLTALTGYTPNDFIKHIRLQRAADLIDKKVGNIADVAYQVGFNNLSYFAKCFKEKFKTTPSEFSKNHSS